ncbi:hypothetical protein AVEN_25082-1 [Araneus ventricosus]|uniref:Uncharacterized protein n=1 Tax=Araneus ventricosus TaxID=182803 RepID=A0A4Y2GVK5_ARAVE|nr:hypothetical protein AVEN_69940-1 [Araneus ventricosus]GBM56124.1 hypothetical protein AVEN_25082-1 [Araneus ventricosus]
MVKDNWNTYRAYLRSDLRNSPPLKSSQPPQTGLRRCEGKISRPPGRIFTKPTLIELRQEIGQYDWFASPRADDVVLCSRMEIITKQAIECGLRISLGFRCLDFANFDLR